MLHWHYPTNSQPACQSVPGKISADKNVAWIWLERINHAKEAARVAYLFWYPTHPTGSHFEARAQVVPSWCWNIRALTFRASIADNNLKYHFCDVDSTWRVVISSVFTLLEDFSCVDIEFYRDAVLFFYGINIAYNIAGTKHWSCDS